ncbi:MAG: peptidylprolyl isomerase [Polyangiaceae bacterium]
MRLAALSLPFTLALPSLLAFTVGCNEDRLKEPDPSAKPVATQTATAKKDDAPPPERPALPKRVEGADDPLKGQWTLADATKDLPGKGALVATMKTSEGELKCKLYDDKAPITVANFIGLATGKRTWKAPSGDWVNKPAYDGTTFHRIIKGFMIQGGDARGNGSGEPGYVIPDEIWAGAKHDRPGLLCMANRGKDTNGAQFFITDAAPAHLDGGYTIFGECAPVDTVHKIASVPVRGERPEKPVTIESVKISRDKG